jgi:nuclear pore complex protein Nup54
MSFSFGGLNNSLGGAERKTGTLFGSTTAPAGGLFGQQQQQQQPAPTQQPTSSLFGSTAAPQQQQQQQNTGSSLFGQVPSNQGSTLFGASQQQQQQQPQSQNPANSIFGGRLYPAPQLPQHQAQQLHQSQNGLPQLRQSTNSPFASTLVQGQSKSIHPCDLINTDYVSRREICNRRDDVREQPMGTLKPKLRLSILFLQLGARE